MRLPTFQIEPRLKIKQISRLARLLVKAGLISEVFKISKFSDFAKLKAIKSNAFSRNKVHLAKQAASIEIEAAKINP